MQYSAPGTNLDKYMKSWGQKCGKMVFPYKFLRSYENLEQKEFPAYDEFTSELTGQKLDPKEYAASKAAYDADPTMHCFLDYLRGYNNSDVEPFFKAVLQQQTWFTQQGLDIFRDGLTLSSHANKIMCRFPLRDASKLTDADLQKLPLLSDANIEQRISGYKEQDRQRRRSRTSSKSSSDSSSLNVEGELSDDEVENDSETGSDNGTAENDIPLDEDTCESDEDEVSDLQDDREYVSVQDVRQALATQCGRCFYCWDVLTDDSWSVDRIDNNQDHWRTNFVLSCLHCNRSKSNRPHDQFYEQQRFLRLGQLKPQIHVIDEAHKQIFYDRPSIVFHRYHEAGKTRIRRVCYNAESKSWDLLEDGKLVHTIVGYDAASLYLWCVGEDMPCGVLEYDARPLSLAGILAEVQNDQFFGFIQADIHVPESLRDYFSEMPPIFKNEKIPFEAIGDYMQSQYRVPDDMVHETDTRPLYPIQRRAND